MTVRSFSTTTWTTSGGYPYLYDYLSEILPGKIHSDVSNCFLVGAALPMTHVAADLHQWFPIPNVDRPCSNNVTTDVSDMCLHLVAFLGRVDLAAIDLVTTLKVRYDIHSPHCRNWSLPGSLSFW
jgi:hypothetical protein